MTLLTPRVLIIDDKREHVEALAAILHKCGMACLPVHFTGEVEDIPRCPHVRTAELLEVACSLPFFYTLVAEVHFFRCQ